MSRRSTGWVHRRTDEHGDPRTGRSRRSVLLTILKSGECLHAGYHQAASRRHAAGDQELAASLAKADEVTAALRPVALRARGGRRRGVKEAVIAAVLTALMILLFLGSWRSTLIVATSRFRSRSSCVDHRSSGALGQTLNLMTLGGLSLAVGILVDDATVEIENIHRNLARCRKPMHARHPRRSAADRGALPSWRRCASASSSSPIAFISGGGEAPLQFPLAHGRRLRDAHCRTSCRAPIVPTMVQLPPRAGARALHEDEVTATATRDVFFGRFVVSDSTSGLRASLREVLRRLARVGARESKRRRVHGRHGLALFVLGVALPFAAPRS